MTFAIMVIFDGHHLFLDMVLPFCWLPHHHRAHNCSFHSTSLHPIQSNPIQSNSIPFHSTSLHPIQPNPIPFLFTTVHYTPLLSTLPATACPLPSSALTGSACTEPCLLKRSNTSVSTRAWIAGPMQGCKDSMKDRTWLTVPSAAMKPSTAVRALTE